MDLYSRDISCRYKKPLKLTFFRTYAPNIRDNSDTIGIIAVCDALILNFQLIALINSHTLKFFRYIW